LWVCHVVPKIWIGELASMGTFLINFLLGACRHGHQSRPFTLDNQTYKVCLDCGKEIGYSLESMTPLSREQRELKIAKAKKPSKDETKHVYQEERNCVNPIMSAQ
jgi:hypothetical protein